MRVRKFATALACAAAAVTLAAAAASAGVTGTTSTQDGMAGYFGNQLGTTYKSMIGTFNLNTAQENIGTTTSLASPQGAVGEQLCANSGGSIGEAAELGYTYNGLTSLGGVKVGTFSVDYALGWLPKGPNDDPCLNGILHNGNRLHALMSNVPVTDTVTLLMYTGRYGVWFAGQDNMTGRSFLDWASCGGYFTHSRHWTNWRWHWYGCPRWNEPGAGVQQNLTLLGGQATSDLVDPSAVFVDTHETTAPATPLGSLNATEVDSSGTGNAPWLVGPAKSVTTGPNGEGCTGQSQFGPLTDGGSSFSICAATPIGA